MDKKLKEMLTNAKITIKWKNCGIWQNEESKNLFDFVGYRCLYLGDKSKVITRFGIKNIN